MQTSYVLQVKNWNLPVAFGICDRVEARYVGTCYRSMGRDISGAALLESGHGRQAVRAWALQRTASSASPEPRPTPSTTGTGAAWRMRSAGSSTPASAKSCRKATDDAVATL